MRMNCSRYSVFDFLQGQGILDDLRERIGDVRVKAGVSANELPVDVFSIFVIIHDQLRSLKVPQILVTHEKCNTVDDHARDYVLWLFDGNTD